MSGAEKKPEGIIGRLEAGGGFLGRLGLVFMVVSITYDVVLRYVFVAPTYWALEVNTFLLAFLCVIPGGRGPPRRRPDSDHFPLPIASSLP